ncbi:hypothetical protein AKJ16_DCAP09848 [Drosera capensis]
MTVSDREEGIGLTCFGIKRSFFGEGLISWRLRLFSFPSGLCACIIMHGAKPSCFLALEPMSSVLKCKNRETYIRHQMWEYLLAAWCSGSIVGVL